MAVSKQKKEEVIKELGDKFARQKSVVFTDYKGFSVSEMTELRRKAKSAGADYKVAKKTLIKLALSGAKMKEMDGKLEGQVGVVFGYEDEVAAPKFSWEFSKKVEKLKILGGYLGNSFLTGAEILALAKLPGKKELRARLVGTINAPIEGFVRVLGSNMSGLLTALKAIGEKKGT